MANLEVMDKLDAGQVRILKALVTEEVANHRTAGINWAELEHLRELLRDVEMVVSGGHGTLVLVLGDVNV